MAVAGQQGKSAVWPTDPALRILANRDGLCALFRFLDGDVHSRLEPVHTHQRLERLDVVVGVKETPVLSRKIEAIFSKDKGEDE